MVNGAAPVQCESSSPRGDDRLAIGKRDKGERMLLVVNLFVVGALDQIGPHRSHQQVLCQLGYDHPSLDLEGQREHCVTSWFVPGNLNISIGEQPSLQGAVMGLNVADVGLHADGHNLDGTKQGALQQFHFSNEKCNSRNVGVNLRSRIETPPVSSDAERSCRAAGVLGPVIGHVLCGTIGDVIGHILWGAVGDVLFHVLVVRPLERVCNVDACPVQVHGEV
mmetsp:Transcript_97726/g.314804  ORF Transcript_97726/g.314804 Transcript_97726/m.314804 type:complete len:222 (-) Transcript_97726:557-1222(-)